MLLAPITLLLLTSLCLTNPWGPKLGGALGTAVHRFAISEIIEEVVTLLGAVGMQLRDGVTAHHCALEAAGGCCGIGSRVERVTGGGDYGDERVLELDASHLQCHIFTGIS